MKCQLKGYKKELLTLGSTSAKMAAFARLLPHMHSADEGRPKEYETNMISF